MRLKPRRSLLLAAAAGAGALTIGGVTAQVSGTYDLTFNALTAGGGTSSATGSPYVLSGAIGQPLAGGPLTAGNFTASAGFFAGAIEVKFKGILPMLSRD